MISLIVTLLTFTWLAVITFLLIRNLLTFGKLTKGVSDKDLREILGEILDGLNKEKETTVNLGKKIEDFRIDGLNHIQKVGFIRYNPFSETGGNQSFVLVILDGNDNGFVITSLHSRDSTRIFAKPVKVGKEAGFEFSKEEIQAIVEAKKKNSK